MNATLYAKKARFPFSTEEAASAVFTLTAAVSAAAVIAMTCYLFFASLPAFKRSGFFSFIFGTKWQAKTETFGIWRMIAGSAALTACAVPLGGFLAVFAAVWLVFYCPKKLKGAYTQMINLLAGIPSIVYGLFGYKFLMPLLAAIFKPGNAGFGLLSCTLVLSIMILPTIASIARNSLEAIPMHYYEGALALGCTKNQAVWTVLLPSAKGGIVAAAILGAGRAIGETMAVQMIVGNGSGYPSGAFVPFTTLTSNIVQNWGYAAPSEQSALIACGFVLLLLILFLNVCLVSSRKESSGDKFFSRRIKEGKTTAPVRYRKGGASQDLLTALSFVIAMSVAFSLAFIVIFVLLKGIPNMSFSFLFARSTNAQTTLAPAFMATFMLMATSLCIALPLGVGAAVYMNEYARRGSSFVKAVRILTDTLAGIPSIVFGLFGMVFFVLALDFGYSLKAGSITLAFLILPTIIRSTEQSLIEVPDSMRSASYALGAGRARTVFTVVLPMAAAGIFTSVILSAGRIMSESAALIFTAGSSSTFMPRGLDDGAASLAVLVWKFMSNGLQIEEAYATAAVLMIFVALQNAIVFFIEHKKAHNEKTK